MKVTENCYVVSIEATTDKNNANEILRLFAGIKGRVDYEFGKQGYSVSDVFKPWSDYNYNKRFSIVVDANEDNIVPIDEEKAKTYQVPNLESLTRKVIEEIQNRDEIKTAFVYRKGIKEHEFLENLITQESSRLYILKGIINEEL